MFTSIWRIRDFFILDLILLILIQLVSRKILPMANGAGGAFLIWENEFFFPKSSSFGTIVVELIPKFWGVAAVVEDDVVCWVVVWSPESILLSITFVGSEDTGVVTSYLHSGHKNNTPAFSTWFPPLFLFLAITSSKQERQNVCWHGSTLWCKSRDSRQTEHSNKSDNVSVTDPFLEAGVAVTEVAASFPPEVVDILNHNQLCKSFGCDFFWVNFFSFFFLICSRHTHRRSVCF